MMGPCLCGDPGCGRCFPQASRQPDTLQHQMRRWARACGKDAKRNLRMADWARERAAMWQGVADRINERAGAVLDDEDSATLDHAIDRVTYYTGIAEHQDAQAVLNAQRAARWALKVVR